MKRITLKAHHGSPGGPADWSFLDKDLDLISADRLTGDGMNKFPSEKGLFLGYSFGSVFALRDVKKFNHPEDSRVVLIAPYLFPQKGVSSAIKTILALPLVGKSILKSKASSSIDIFLKKSAAPDAPPVSYLNEKEKLTNPALLKLSMLEKDIKRPETEGLLTWINDNNIPLTIIWGDSDDSSTYEAQIQPILDLVPGATVITRKSKGHALVWTDTENCNSIIKSEMEALNGQARL